MRVLIEKTILFQNFTLTECFIKVPDDRKYVCGNFLTNITDLGSVVFLKWFINTDSVCERLPLHFQAKISSFTLSTMISLLGFISLLFEFSREFSLQLHGDAGNPGGALFI